MMRRFLFWLKGLGELIGRYKQVSQVSWQSRDTTDLKGYTREEAEFLPAALALQETPVPVLPRVIIWVIAIGCVVGVAWSIIGKVDIVATAQGKVVTNARSKVVQSLETLRVKAIHVRDGQHVKRGDVLIEMDDNDAKTNDVRTHQELTMARLQAERSRALLEAIRKNSPPVMDAIDTVEPELLKQEQALAESLYTEYASRIGQMKATELRHQAEKRTSEATVARLRKSLPFTDQRANDYKKLADTDYVPRHEFLLREQQRIELRGDLSIQETRIQELHAAMVELQRQREALTAEMLRTFSSSLNEAQQKIARFTVERQKTAGRLQDMHLLSPVDGIVQQLAVHTLGGVVTPAQPLMIIVPIGEVVEIEAIIENKDIGFVSAGQAVEIKIEAFPYTKYGTLHGKVHNVSSDAIIDEKKGLIYLAHIHLDQKFMDVGDKKVPLTPGMAVTAEIKTGKRRLIEFFLAPFVEYRKESLKER